jgi:hypothetical protein
LGFRRLFLDILNARYHFMAGNTASHGGYANQRKHCNQRQGHCAGEGESAASADGCAESAMASGRILKCSAHSF